MRHGDIKEVKRNEYPTVDALMEHEITEKTKRGVAECESKVGVGKSYLYEYS